MFLYGLKATSLVLVAVNEILKLSVGGMYPFPTTVCDTSEAAVSIISEDGENGLHAMDQLYDKLVAQGVCRVESGPFHIEGPKEHPVVTARGEAAVVKLSQEGKVYWGILLDVDVEVP